MVSEVVCKCSRLGVARRDMTGSSLNVKPGSQAPNRRLEFTFDRASDSYLLYPIEFFSASHPTASCLLRIEVNHANHTIAVPA